MSEPVIDEQEQEAVRQFLKWAGANVVVADAVAVFGEKRAEGKSVYEAIAETKASWVLD